MSRDGSMIFRLNYRFCLTIFLLAIMLTTGCFYKSYENMEVGEEVQMGMTTFSSNQADEPYNRFPQYNIVPGDILDVLFQIRSWEKQKKFNIQVDQIVTVKFLRIPELSETQKVRPDGKISLPYLGDVLVVGKSPGELKAELLKPYSKIFQTPEINVVVDEFRGRILDFKKDLHTSPRGLSRLVSVRPDGFITFPLIGDIFVAGKTIPEVKAIMNEKYAVVMPGLHSDLFLEEHAGSVVYVAGMVQTPGSYPISRPVTILEAITLAGGHLYGAKLDSIIVTRKVDQVMTATKVDFSKNLDFTESSVFFYLQPNDIVFVPATRIFSAAQVANSIADIIQFRGWGFTTNFTYRLNDTRSNNDFVPNN